VTISSTTNKAQYVGNGVTTSFSFPYIFFAQADLSVSLFDTSTGLAVSPAPVLNGGTTYDYAVTGIMDPATGEYLSGGSVVFNIAPPSNYRITIQRVLSFTQLIQLIDNNKFPAATVNGALDRLTIFAQQLNQAYAQALLTPDSDTTAIGRLPNSTARANAFLAFDGSGNPYAALAVGSAPAASTYVINTIFPLTTPAAFRAALAAAGLADNNAFTGANSHAGVETFANAINENRGTAIPSAATTDIGAATGNFVHITGTVTITALGTIQAGTRRTLVFDGALTLTHNATSLICLGGANILTAVGDTAEFESEGSGNWRMTAYARADGTPLSLGVMTRTRIFTSTNPVGTTAIPTDNTPPQITEGTAIGAFSVNFTPKTATKIIRIRAVIPAAGNSADFYAAALFIDGAANAVSADWKRTDGNAYGHFILDYEAAFSIASHSVQVRVGPNTAGGSTIINGYSGNTNLGNGLMGAVMTIEELPF
jgi:hypothetical protein